MSNRNILIQKLEQAIEFDGRYINLKCVNYDMATGVKQGCFSLVFKAIDKLENKHVAIKFYDPDPSTMGNQYRIKAFEREPQILESLRQKFRCLQLHSGLRTYSLDIPMGPDQVFQLPCKYFVIEWLEDEVEDFFENQEIIDAIAKLQLFQEISLAVAALHRHEVHHRDLKVDNLRLKKESTKEVVVAIDLGASARAFDENLMEDYDKQAGAPAYAAPEAVLGLCGERSIGHLTDWYALGCLLFELFNKDLYYIAVRKSSPRTDAVLAAIGFAMQNYKDKKDRSIKYDEHLSKFKHLFNSAHVEEGSSSVPLAIVSELNLLIHDLTSFDYRYRLKTISDITSRVQRCIKILENHDLVQKRKEEKLIWRQNRIEKIKRRQARVQALVAGGAR